MSWRKDQLVKFALEEIGIPQDEIQPHELESGIVRLNVMLSDWNGEGIRIKAPLSSSPDVEDTRQDSSIPDWAFRAVITNLALDLAPSYGRAPSMATVVAAKKSKKTLRNRTGYPVPDQVFNSHLPLGAGNARHGQTRTYVGETEEPLLAGDDKELEL
jgi:hypothetical protein